MGAARWFVSGVRVVEGEGLVGVDIPVDWLSFIYHDGGHRYVAVRFAISDIE